MHLRCYRRSIYRQPVAPHLKSTGCSQQAAVNQLLSTGCSQPAAVNQLLSTDCSQSAAVTQQQQRQVEITTISVMKATEEQKQHISASVLDMSKCTCFSTRVQYHTQYHSIILSIKVSLSGKVPPLVPMYNIVSQYHPQ